MTKTLAADLDLAIQKICSPIYEQMFERVAREMPTSLSDQESFVLMHYPSKFNWYEDEQRSALIDRFRRAHMTWFNRWLNEYATGQPPYVEWNSIMETVMLNLGNLFFPEQGSVQVSHVHVIHLYVG